MGNELRVEFAEPYKFKIVTFPKYLDLAGRKFVLESNNNNANLIDSNYIFTDLSTVNISAFSDNQYSSLFLGDEAYAGSKNFLNIQENIKKLFNKRYVVPSHNIRGAWNLVFKLIERIGSPNFPNLFHYNHLEQRYFHNLASYYYNNYLNNSHSPDISIFFLNSIESYKYSFDEINSILNDIRKKSKVVIADFSNVFSFTNSELEKILSLSDIVDVIVLDTSYDISSNNGALIITDNFSHYEYLTEWVVAFEGLHTYGGLAGRDMEVINTGLLEATNPDIWKHKKTQIKYLYDQISKIVGKAISENYNVHYFYIRNVSKDFNNLLFLSSQVRAYQLEDYLFIYLPSRKYRKQNLDLFLDTFRTVFESNNINYVDPRVFVSFNSKVVEFVSISSFNNRKEVLEKAGYNTFLIPSKDVYLDFLTDSGTSSQSDEQWSAAIFYDQKRAYNLLKDSIEDVFGFNYFLPTHQGRAAEHILSKTLIKPNQFVINNMYFTTTRFHQEYAGGVFVDLIIEEAYKPDFEHPFKGNIDVDKLVDFIEKNGNVAYVCVENNVNMAGGQPVSMENLKQVRKICDYYGIPLVLDATRIAENAFFIKEREQGYKDKSIKEIIREMMALADAATISAKKDPLTNISGLILVRSYDLYKKMRNLLEIFEGEYYDGGLNSRDVAALAKGLIEMTDYYYLKDRIEQVRYLGKLLKDKSIPIVEPIGGHAIYLDAKRFLPHIKQDDFPAQTLAAYIYLYGGVRTMERGIVSAGRDPKTNKHKYPELELVRITIPRRVYTNEHMDYTADVIKKVYSDREKISGLSIVYEPPFLRFFTMRFKPLSFVH